MKIGHTAGAWGWIATFVLLAMWAAERPLQASDDGEQDSVGAQVGRYVSLGDSGLLILDTSSGTRYGIAEGRAVAIGLDGSRWTPSDPETERTLEDMRATLQNLQPETATTGRIPTLEELREADATNSGVAP